MTDDAFTRNLARQLAQELDAVPLTAPNPGRARYRAQPTRLPATHRLVAGRTLGLAGAAAIALVSSVVLASAAPGVSAWRAGAEMAISVLVGNAPAPPQPAAAPLPKPGPSDQPLEPEADKTASGSIPTPAPANDQVGPARRASSATGEEDRLPATEDKPERREEAPGDTSDQVKREEPAGREKEKTSDISSHRSSSGKP